ncbi:MAG: cadherin-like domain-containing protein [Actinomycetota bacterium]
MIWRARVSTLTVVAVALLGFGPAASAATQVGFKAHSYAGFDAETSAGAITGQKPESKLWFNAGKWWAVMLSPPNNGAHTIWRLDDGGWVNTNVVVDGRAATKEDVLWTGSKLYVTSRSAGSSNLLRRFTWTGTTYTLDSGFPADLGITKPETLTIARDSLGTLWVTYEQDLNIYVKRSQGGLDTSWGAPFVIPVPGASGVLDDDISTIISFTDNIGPAIGVMWSNQSTDADYFAVHRDGDADSSWTVETALSGSNQAEDHFNLKTFEGRVYAAAKTEVKKGAQILIKLLVRSPGGSWASHNVATFAEGDTRPIAVLNVDPTQRKIYIFMTKGEGAAAVGIFYKVTGVDAIGFPSTATPFIQGPNGETINDATSTKQNTDATSGLVVLASDGDSYWWNRIGGGTPGASPNAVAGSASTTEDTPVQVTLNGNDADTCDLIFSVASAPSHGSLGAIANQACTNGSPNTDKATVTYTPATDYAGSDSFTFTVHDGTSASSPATISLTVNAVNDVPTALSGSTSTTTDTPVTVTLNGTDPESCSLTFAISQQPGHGSLGAITNQACVAGSPNADRATLTYTPAAGYTGSDSFKFTVNDGSLTSPAATISITIGAASAGITLRSASSAANPTATSLTISAPAGLAPGDVMLAGISVRGNTTIAPPAGWTFVRLDATSEFIFRQAVYFKVAGSEPASYSFTFNSNQAAAGGIAAYSGVNTANPIDAHSGQVSNFLRFATITAPSVTTTQNGAMLVGFFGMADNVTIAPPSGMTERWDVASNAGAFFMTQEGADALQPTAGASGSKVATAPVKGWNIGQLVALRPAGADPSPSPSPSPSPTKPPRG